MRFRVWALQQWGPTYSSTLHIGTPEPWGNSHIQHAAEVRQAVRLLSFSEKFNLAVALDRLRHFSLESP